jgi:hypothetical protein
MKKRLVLALILILAMPALACKLFSGTPTPTALPPMNHAPTEEFIPPTPLEALPTDTEVVEPTQEEQPTVVIETTVVEQPTQIAEATPLPLVPTATTGEAGIAGLIESVTLARSTTGNDKSPVDPTNVFSASDVIHAVVHLNHAPANTKVTATWYVVDVGSAADPNSQIDSTDITTDGSRNVDFSLSPQPKWPVGSYKVEIGLNGQLVKTLEYSVK